MRGGETMSKALGLNRITLSAKILSEIQTWRHMCRCTYACTLISSHLPQHGYRWHHLKETHTVNTQTHTECGRPASVLLRWIYLSVPGRSLSPASQSDCYDSSGKVGRGWQEGHDGEELLNRNGEISHWQTGRKEMQKNSGKGSLFCFQLATNNNYNNNNIYLKKKCLSGL